MRVNGVKVDRRPYPLRPGDEIALGDTRLCLEDPWPADPEPAAARPERAAPRARRRGARIPPAFAAALLLALSAAALAVAAS